MRPIISFIERFPLVTFFAIAYATSFAGFSLYDKFPSDWWSLFVYGPFLGALVVTAIQEGREGLRSWASRIIRWRVAPWTYPAALLLPLVFQLIAFALDPIFGVEKADWPQPAVWLETVPEFVFIFLFVGLAEEPGFRGFALPRLLNGRSPLRASLILGVLHTIWHLPLFVYGAEPLTIIPIILSGAVLLTWLFLHANGSVLLPMLMHASVNTAASVFDSEDPRHTMVLAGIYVLSAATLVAVTGTALVRSKESRPRNVYKNGN